MSSPFGLVGGSAPKPRPVWESKAVEICDRYGEFAKPLLYDWKRTVKRTKSNGIRQANQRLDALRKQFKIGDFLVHQTEDQYLKDYATVKARKLIRKLRSWPSVMPLEQAVEKALPYFEHHEFDDTECLQKYLKACMAVAMCADVLRNAIETGGHYGDGDVTSEQNVYDDAVEERNKLVPKAMGLLKRCQNEDWWRGKLRRAQNQRIEKISRELHQVVITRSAYCSPIGKREWQRRQQINMDMLEHTLMENDEGEQFTLADLSELSVANPMVRRTELMVRIAGFELHAKELQYEGHFLTLTTPSKYHAAHKVGHRNAKFNGASPRDGQLYFCKLWARFRAKAARITKSKPEAWDFFGIRVAEPHHDGTPHWHLLLFINPEHAPDVIKELRKLAEEEDHHELLNAQPDVRFKAERIKEGINPNTGKEYSAAGYIAKYIAKNIDGEHIDEDLYGQDAKAAAKDIIAWSSRNSIRQFQQVGGPKVGVWRELRRLVNLPEDQWQDDDQPLRDFVFKLDEIAQESAAEAWKTYCQFFDDNGLSLTKTLRTISQAIDYLDEAGQQYETELERPALNAYGEPVEQTEGVLFEVNSEDTQRYIEKVSRWRTWFRVESTPEQAFEIRQQRIEERAARQRAKEEARQAEAVASESAGLIFGASAPPWTGVNNCTGSPPAVIEPPSAAPPEPQNFELFQ